MDIQINLPLPIKMSDNIQLPSTQTSIATDEVAGVHYQQVKVVLGGDGDNAGSVSLFNPLPVKLDAASLLALENINVTVENPSNAGLTDTQLRATPVPVSMGLPSGASTESTLLALKGVLDNLKTAVDTLNAKTNLVDTSNVVLSSETLNALENTTVTVSNPTPQGLTNTELRATTLATNDASVQAIQNNIADLSTSIRDLNDGILYMLSSILEKMPRIDRVDRVTAQVSDANGNELNSPLYGISSNLVGESGGKSYSRILEPFNFSTMGANHLYNQITITA
jgi:hypothetical protein